MAVNDITKNHQMDTFAVNILQPSYFEYKQCGCKFPLDQNGNIIFDPQISSINLECSATWDLISSGNTKGCFQLESRLEYEH